MSGQFQQLKSVMKIDISNREQRICLQFYLVFKVALQVYLLNQTINLLKNGIFSYQYKVHFLEYFNLSYRQLNNNYFQTIIAALEQNIWMTIRQSI
ncbi:unnamed protein product (macronuclear) [Paramecium tetraurelia]|uniref:Transmembrane protein n=1 Tax=Paramecium tetraurelia TaxID=5888 RepID=A0DFS9_PARTE|nr:uncharacterized protein GSPATT00016709001 [Paramecium tetraurelia]CAK81896.1 unnamed protein product [Paramecium tetraurelia]|eukprot:XP_001449293.1 hypothetical protein (macronuclear) [Paramecium tetraurelia strain d4-2]